LRRLPFDFAKACRHFPAAMHAPRPAVAPVEAAALVLPGIAHGFFTREGGVSEGIYAGLNTGIGSSDIREAVLENRTRAARFLRIASENLATPYQVHGTTAVIVTEPWGPGLGPKADAVVTNQPGIAVGVGAADCGPVLFADATAGIIAAAHAGWKGAFTGVLESTIATMESLGAARKNIVAVLGPTISARAYEVGPEFVARFAEQSTDNARYFRPSNRAGHSFFDLPGYIVARLGHAGIGGAHDVGLCTYSDAARFFSYRRATHRGEPDYGRNLSAIALVGA
jgi:polyphenol oxidase